MEMGMFRAVVADGTPAGRDDQAVWVEKRMTARSSASSAKGAVLTVPRPCTGPSPISSGGPTSTAGTRPSSEDHHPRGRTGRLG